eukprot:m.129285 g.129285  ORF g.129285 m.129285 type:complete len:81 (+) comp17458_c0_seq3:45-287(+)
MSAVRASATLLRRSVARPQAPIRGGENFQGPGDSLPFSSGASTSKPLMAVKVVAFFMVPFSVPFIAAKRSISKNGLTTKW